MDGTDLEYNDALLKVIHDEEPKGVAMGVNIQVRSIACKFLINAVVVTGCICEHLDPYNLVFYQPFLTTFVRRLFEIR